MNHRRGSVSLVITSLAIACSDTAPAPSDAKPTAPTDAETTSGPAKEAKDRGSWRTR